MKSTELQAIYPLIIVNDLQPIRRFYCDVLRAQILFDLPHYLQFKIPCLQAPEVAFTVPDSKADGYLADDRRPFAGHGLILSLQVDDVDAHHRELAPRVSSAVQAPADRPWQWRSYMIADPSGTLLDFYTPLAKAT